MGYKACQRWQMGMGPRGRRSDLLLDLVRQSTLRLRKLADSLGVPAREPRCHKPLTCPGELLSSSLGTSSDPRLQIVLSHFSMSSADLGPVESFPHRQLRTTSDVICNPSLAFLHGGLHLQVTHHLFPRLPRHNLSRASLLVKEFAREQGLTYAEFGFVNGNKEVLGVLQDVAEQVKLLGKVAA